MAFVVGKEKFLRGTDNPQFTNKNATIDQDEGDNTLVAFQAEINEGRGLSAVEGFDGGRKYQFDQFTQFEFNIYKYISDVAASGVIPGTEDEKWALSSIGEFLLSKNFVVVTAQELSDLQQSSALQKGRSYFISDTNLFECRGYNITASATEVNRLDIKASIHSLVGDFQDIGIYTTVELFNSQLGTWKDTKGTLNYDNLAGGPFTVGETVTGGVSGATGIVVDDTDPTLTLSSIVGVFANDEVLTGATSGATADADGVPVFTFGPIIGDVVIWDGRHYRKKTADIVSTEPDADGDNWEVLDYSLTNGYVLENDEIDIDLSDELNAAFQPSVNYDTLILRRRDKRANDVHSPLLFQWGNDDVKGNIVRKGATLDCINTLQSVQFNEIINIVLIANMSTSGFKNNIVNSRGGTLDVSNSVVDLENIGKLITEEIRIPSAEVLTLNSLRKLFISKAGTGTGIDIISATGKLEFLTAGGVVYGTNVDVHLISDTATKPLMTLSGILAASLISARTFRDDEVLGPADTQVEDDKDVFIFVPGGEPLNGNGVFCVSAVYRIFISDC